MPRGTFRPQKRQDGSAFAFGVSPPAQVLQLTGCLCHRTPASHGVEGATNRRVPALHGHYPASALLRTHPSPSRLRLIFRWTGSTTYLASMLSLPPRRSGPPRQPVCDGPCCLHLHGCRLGLRGYHVRGHLCVRLRYGLETRPHPEDEAVERLQKVGFPSPGSPSSRALAFPLGGFSPPEHASLCWTHNRTYTFRRIRLSILEFRWSVREFSGMEFVMTLDAED